MKQCEGYPQVGCEKEATVDMLGYQLCDACADNWRTQGTAAADNKLAAAHEYIKLLEHALSSCRYMANARQSPPSEVFKSICEIADRVLS